MSQSTDPKTLGQRIDEVLEPLYSEAEQHREAIAQAQATLQAAQQQFDQATQGLAEVESRMTEVVRSLAQQEPVLAAVLGSAAESTATATEQAADAPAEVEPDTVPTDLDPEIDAAMTDEAAALLDAEPDSDGGESDSIQADDAAEEAPPADITAAAERAAAAAKQLRENAGAVR